MVPMSRLTAFLLILCAVCNLKIGEGLLNLSVNVRSLKKCGAVRPFDLHMSALATSENLKVIEFLRDACETRKVPSTDIARIIDQIESLKLDVECSDMRGSWELVYSSLIPGGYFPVCEIADFFGYSLTSSWGPLPLGGFRGKSTIISQTKPATIEFSSEMFKLGGLEINLKEPKQRSYTFLYSDSLIAVARSSSGGGTLLKRVIQ
jgi:hypothetical protein